MYLILTETTLFQICKKLVFPHDFQNPPYNIDVILTRVFDIDEDVI